MLCQICQSIDSDDLFAEPGVVSRAVHHKSYSGLRESAELGCELCSAIVATVLQGPSHLVPALENGYLRGRQILLRALFKGREKEEYEYLGSSQIWVACGAEKIAKLDIFIEPGMLPVSSKFLPEVGFIFSNSMATSTLSLTSLRFPFSER
jgi:hypothetical protein